MAPPRLPRLGAIQRRSARARVQRRRHARDRAGLRRRAGAARLATERRRHRARQHSRTARGADGCATASCSSKWRCRSCCSSGSGLMIRSFYALQQVDPGYDPRDLLTFFRQAAAADGGGARRVLRQVTERLRALPGVVGVGGRGQPAPARRRHRPTSRGRPKKPAAPIRRRSGRRTSFYVTPGLLRDDEDAAHRRPHVHRRRQHAGAIGEGRDRRSRGGAGVSRTASPSAGRCSSATCVAAARMRRPTTRSRSSASSRTSGTNR